MNLTVNVAEDAVLTPIAEMLDAAPESVLHGQMSVMGLMCHVEAYQVTKSPHGELTVVNPCYEDELEALYRLSGSSLATVVLNGREYVIAVFPHAK